MAPTAAIVSLTPHKPASVALFAWTPVETLRVLHGLATQDYLDQVQNRTKEKRFTFDIAFGVNVSAWQGAGGVRATKQHGMGQSAVCSRRLSPCECRRRCSSQEDGGSHQDMGTSRGGSAAGMVAPRSLGL